MNDITNDKDKLAKILAKGKSPAAAPATPIAAIPAPAGSQAVEGDDPKRADVSRNAPTPVTPPAAAKPQGNWQLVPAAKLIPREDNPRRLDEKAQSYKDLVASIRSAGIITPLLGRPHPEKKNCIELLAGHRRRAAGLAAELVEFPIVVREMDDQRAIEVLVFENLDRENLTPLEEARGVDLLLKSKHGANEIALRMGKTVAWVARRVSLLKLTKKWKEWAEERSNVSAAHLELLARCPATTQEMLFETMREDDVGAFFVDPGSLKALRSWIGEQLMDLKQALWDPANAVLVPKAGACSACPKRSGCQPNLFSDPEDGKEDRCLDRACWKSKTTAHLAQRKAALKKEHPSLVLIEGKDARYEDRREIEGIITDWNFRECKASEKGAVPALIACGKGTGSLTWVQMGHGGGTREKVAAKKKGSAAGKQAAASLDPKESAKLLKERQEAHEKRRWAWVCKRLQEIIDEQDLPVDPAMNSPQGICVLVSIFGTEGGMPYPFTDGSRWRELDKLGSAAGKEVMMKIWKALKPRIKQTLEVFTVGELGKGHHAAIKGAAGLVCLKVETLKASADREIPEPKSWDQLRKLSEAPAAKKSAVKELKQKVAKGAKPDKKAPAAKRMTPAGRKMIDKLTGKKPTAADATWTPADEKKRSKGSAGASPHQKNGRKAS